MKQNDIEKISKSLKYIEFLLKEVIETLENSKETDEAKEDGNIHKNAWVVLPYNQCITTYPPSYVSTIYHYHSDEGLHTEFLGRGYNEKIFYSEEDAKEYVKSLGCEYDIVNVKEPKDIMVIGDDYE